MGTSPDNLTEYEKSQNYNFLTAWLHSFRYHSIQGIFRTLAAEIPDRPLQVVEIGCAHAKLFHTLDAEFRIDYSGIELDQGFVETSRQRYGGRPNFRVLHGSAADEELMGGLPSTDVVVALETLEHIPEHQVVRVVERVAALKPRLFVCSVPVEVGPAVAFKNVGSLLAGYGRHHEYSWGETFWAGLYQLDRLPPHSTGHKGFDWRWLAQTLRHNFEITETRRFPVGFLPAAFSTSVFFVCRPRS